MVQKIDPWGNPEKYSSWYECPDCGLKATEPEFEKRSNKNEKSNKLAGVETRRPLYPREYKRCPKCDTQPRKLHTLFDILLRLKAGGFPSVGSFKIYSLPPVPVVGIRRRGHTGRLLAVPTSRYSYPQRQYNQTGYLPHQLNHSHHQTQSYFG